MDANRSADAPYFSVVIPTYNRAHIIGATIGSVLGQTDPDFEVIVVDDGGTDATEDVVRAVPDARVLYHRKDNAERAAARNFGAARARGRYVEFLDSDDVLYPHHLAAARRLIAAAGDPELVHLGYELKDSAGAVVGRAGPFEGALNDYLPNGNVLSCRGVLLRGDIARGFPFNEDRELSGSEDWELWLRLASRFEIPYSNEVTSAILGHDARSVLTADERSLVRRMDLTLGYLRRDEAFLAAFGDRQRDVEAEFLSYIALHLALRGEPLRALRYAARSLRVRPRSAFSRRFLAIGKHVLLGTVARQRRPRRP
jgi:glycosyltransferase involved in cell wall biosynthesis